jgi:hypothetical protein
VAPPAASCCAAAGTIMEDTSMPNATVEMLINLAPHDIVFSPKSRIFPQSQKSRVGLTGPI